MSQAGTVVGETTGRHIRQAFSWSYGAHTTLPYLGGQDQLGGYMSTAAAVNFLGLVVGCSTTDNGEQHACLWSGGASRDLGTLGGPGSSAAAVNDLGQVVGTSLTSTGTSRGFIWSNGRMRDLGTLGGEWSNAIGVNNVGHVVGNSESPDGQAHAFWWRKGRMTSLGPLEGDQHSEAVAVNGRGQVLVRSYGSCVRGFLWAHGRRTEIRGIGAGSVDPAGLNDNGVVCGTVGLPNGEGHAFRWQQRVLTDLGTLGGPLSAAYSVTATGIVLGEAEEAAAPVSRPAFWAP
ncbi:HAF repeat-containing protein [Frankia sp. R82]|uniref:HAF repeat-containing protein n=1 Tax=Frankia sp. R82 TaxID=2950553 RepID=UPI002042C3B4|nr:HAF repeat-containing protein [Frankia sp. R82]MCM3885616.1 HAF repeat-containing protein [Frankia sp. R82]